MDNLNVCLINDSFPPVIDGVATAVCNYARIITEKHGRAAVFTPYYPDADDSQYAFPVYRYPSLDLSKQVGYRAGIPFSPKLMGTVKDAGFDIIHSHCPVSSTLLARSLRETLDVPVVMTYHTKFDIDIANAVQGKLVQAEMIQLLVKNIDACDEVWTVSRGAGENLRSLGFDKPYVIMPNGVDFPKGRVSEELVQEVTGGLDLPAGVPVLLFVGRMMWYKGIRIILDALKTLDDEGRVFRMVFVGGGGDAAEIHAYAEELSLMDKVFFVEPIRDRVLVRGSCAAEDSTDGVTSFLIEENAQSMAAMLRRLLTEPECIRRVGEAAQQDLYLSWEDAVDNACRGYAAVIENYRSGRYPRHDTPTDEIIHRLTKAMEWVDQAELLRDLREPPRSSEELLALLRRRRDQLGQSFHRPDRFL